MDNEIHSMCCRSRPKSHLPGTVRSGHRMPLTTVGRHVRSVDRPSLGRQQDPEHVCHVLGVEQLPAGKLSEEALVGMGSSTAIRADRLPGTSIDPVLTEFTRTPSAGDRRHQHDRRHRRPAQIRQGGASEPYGMADVEVERGRPAVVRGLGEGRRIPVAARVGDHAVHRAEPAANVRDEPSSTAPSVTSAAPAVHGTPNLSLNRSANSVSRRPSRAHRPSRQPVAASSRANAAPNPEDAPVTMTVRPACPRADTSSPARRLTAPHWTIRGPLSRHRKQGPSPLPGTGAPRPRGVDRNHVLTPPGDRK